MEKEKRLEIFIGLYQYLVLGGQKRPATEYPKDGIKESDAEILAELLDDGTKGKKVIADKITGDEKRFTAYVTPEQYKEFLIAIEDDRIEIDIT